MTLLLFSPALSGVECNMDMKIEFEFREGAPSDAACAKIIVYMDPAAWQFFMLKKDLHSESLRWFLLLQEFEFEASEKG